MTARPRPPEHCPSVDVIFPISSMRLLPHLRNAAAAVVNQEYPSNLVKIYVSYFYNPEKDEDIGELAEYCKELDAVLVMNTWKDPAFSRGQAFNAGIRCGCGEVVACLDADVVIHRLTFSKLRGLLNQGRSVVVTVGRTELTPEKFEPLDDEAWQELSEESPHLRTGLGNILVRRSTMEALHGYDERYYGWGGGDTELFVRLNRYGSMVYSIDVGCPKALHQWHPATATRNTKCTNRNRKLLLGDRECEQWAKEESVVKNRDGVWGCVFPSREQLGRNRTITTALVHTPLRPLACALETLESLRHATTTLSHRVELIIQGPLQDGAVAPKPEDYPEFELCVFQEAENLGVPTRVAESTERLATDFWAKLDDDAAVPPGAWDVLVRILDEETGRRQKVGCVFMAPDNKEPVIKVFERRGNVLGVIAAPHMTREAGFAKWHLVDCVSSGATVFRKAVFDEGCCFVLDYFSGCSDNDICWQMHSLGFMAATCVEPRSFHFHARCAPKAYTETRYSKEHFVHSADVFWDRWGMADGQHPVGPTNYRP